MKDEEFGLGLLALQVQLTHATQLFKCLVDVSDPQPLASIVGHPPLALALRLLLGIQVLVIINTTAVANRTEQSVQKKTNRFMVLKFNEECFKGSTSVM